MALQLSQKETTLLKDQETHEKVCIEKYQKYAAQASDPQLKQLFESFAQQEQQHLNTITSIMSGQVPSMNQGQQGQQAAQSSSQSMQATNQTAQSSTASASANNADAMLCKDMLMTEKYVSNAYDTAIFEFTDTNVRQALNHIQKEEQKHGEGIFNYLSSKGLYNVQ
ncbi:spore coat protein [Sporomusa sp.]|jgi:spore coat protein CotF|uniref:spore coat protein n=1 Tax=Sporomusa sp. TaxID=2078658 RepID=UPI002C91547E|nr:spore coat protein [Sporomusa sp.]MDF2875252.1 Coat domain protein [Sporomusa sp.]HWR09881.1 spore coat protein [Sporomusa sp.]